MAEGSVAYLAWRYPESMKILVVGATGTIGSAVTHALNARGHEVVESSRHRQPVVDLDNAASIAAVFQRASNLNAVVCCAGAAAFKPLADLTLADFELGLRSKLMGQVMLAQIAKDHLAAGGSITLTSGVLARQPMPGSAAVSLVNAALEGYVRAAALELPRALRINVVSPPWVRETLLQLHMDPSLGMPAAEIARAYVASVEGVAQGAVIEPASA